MVQREDSSATVAPFQCKDFHEPSEVALIRYWFDKGSRSRRELPPLVYASEQAYSIPNRTIKIAHESQNRIISHYQIRVSSLSAIRALSMVHADCLTTTVTRSGN